MKETPPWILKFAPHLLVVAEPHSGPAPEELEVFVRALETTPLEIWSASAPQKADAK